MKTINEILQHVLLATNFMFNPTVDDLPEDLECLAKNVYFEARSEKDIDGKLWVADVVLNRVDDPRYPNTVCEVVQQSKWNQWYLDNLGQKIPSRHRCQFSWFCDGKSDDPKNIHSWQSSIIIAQYMLMQPREYRAVAFSKGATHYHANYVSPYWIEDVKMVYLGQAGTHLFYQWR